MIWEIPPYLQYKDKNSGKSVLSTNSVQIARSWFNCCAETCSYLLTSLFTPWSRVLLEKLTGSQLVKKFSVFYGILRFITPLQVPAICPYPEPVQFSPCPHPTS